MITNTYTYLLRFWLARTGQNPQLRARQNNAQPVRKQNTAGQAAIPSRRYGCLPAHLCAARADWYGVIHGIKDRQVGNKTPGVTNPQLALGPNRQAHCVRCVVSLVVILFASSANNAGDHPTAARARCPASGPSHALSCPALRLWPTRFLFDARLGE